MSSPTTSSSSPPNYGGLYGGLAFVATALTGGQIYADQDDGSLRIDYLSLWQMLGTPNGASLAFFALALLGALVALCAYAVVQPVTTIAIPVSVIVIAAIAVLMLLAKVGSSRDPDYDTAGAMLLVSCWAAMLLGGVHTAHLLRWRASR